MTGTGAPIGVDCPRCRRRLVFRLHRQEPSKAKVKCPACGEEFLARRPGPAPQAAAEPRRPIRQWWWLRALVVSALLVSAFFLLRPKPAEEAEKKGAAVGSLAVIGCLVEAPHPSSWLLRAYLSEELRLLEGLRVASLAEVERAYRDLHLELPSPPPT
ncbi:MAG: hypothetical protein KDD47_07845, partial [Acidobacteria bacterium]|nr:hypothetical protein [Acidobacteriota bacterium]